MHRLETLLVIAALLAVPVLAGCSGRGPIDPAGELPTSTASGSPAGSAAEPVAPDTSGPAGEPTVRGVLVLDENTAMLRLTEPTDPYYERMAVRLDDGIPVTTATGEPADPARVTSGVTVDLWISRGCNESYPVQCSIGAIRLVDP